MDGESCVSASLILVAAASLMAMTAFFLASCSVGTTTGVSNSNKTDDSASSTSWDGSFAGTADSLEGLAKQASDAVVGNAGKSTVETISGVPFTVTEFHVIDSASGRLDGSMIRVRQSGDEFNTDEMFAPLLLPADKYLLFVEPFELVPGKETGQMVISDGIAAWKSSGEGSRFNLSLGAREAEALPTSITFQDAIDAMN